MIVFARGNQKYLMRLYFLLKDLSESHSYITGNRYSILSWRSNPIVYFYKKERINKNGSKIFNNS